MQVYLTTLGCRLNEAELESWTRDFRAAGHTLVERPDDAQVMVLNTCAVTTEAARKSRKLVGGLHRQNPSANLVMTGCFAELEPERAAALSGVDMVVGNRDKERLVDLVSERFTVATMPTLAMAADGAGAHVFQESGRTRAFIKVQDGCRNRCSFCIVTIARGDERSRTIESVVAEIDGLARAGYREAVLTGVHLGGYGSDIGTDLRALVEAVLARTEIERVRLSSLEPWDLPEGFFELWQDERLMPHLHLPLQSGSDSVLKRMARRCSTGEYARLVDAARSAIPELGLTTDIIVGFPGETEDEWRQTLDFVRSIGFAHMHIFSYSPRDGTKAARLSGQVHGATKRARSRELHEIAAAMKSAYMERHLGQVRSVLWEGIGHATGEKNGLSRRFSGYTDNYLRVETDSLRPLGNRITDALLCGPLVEGGHLRARVTE